jgi:hypothetical protein
MMMETIQKLHIGNLQPTPTILKLADRSNIKPEGVIEDITVSLDSWEYPIDIMILQPKSNLGGHPLIIGRPWLETVDAFISCRSRNMTITNGVEIKHISLYSPAKSVNELKHVKWLNEDNSANLDNCTSFKY